MVSLRAGVQERSEKLAISWDWTLQQTADLLSLCVQAFDASHSYESHGKMCWSIPQGLQRKTEPDSGFRISQLPSGLGSMFLPFFFIFPFLGGQNLVKGKIFAALTLYFSVAQQ